MTSSNRGAGEKKVVADCCSKSTSIFLQASTGTQLSWHITYLEALSVCFDVNKTFFFLIYKVFWKKMFSAPWKSKPTCFSIFPSPHPLHCSAQPHMRYSKQACIWEYTGDHLTTLLVFCSGIFFLWQAEWVSQALSLHVATIFPNVIWIKERSCRAPVFISK